MENAINAKPGLNVNIVLTVDNEREISDVKSAIIYDIVGADIILSQVNPPVRRELKGKDITVTYLIGSGNTVKRFGFNGKIADIITDYSLSSSNLVPAILIKKTSGSKQYDLRMHYRVKPRLGDHSIALYVGTEKVNLIDISIGGARFCHKKDHHIEPGKIMKATLHVDGITFYPDIRTLSVWLPPETGKLPELEYAMVQFLNMDNKCSHALNGKIMEIQRTPLSKT